MSQNPMVYSGHPTPSQTPMHFRGGGVSKKLYNTSTQPRNISYNHQHTQYYERRHNVIDDIGLEVGSHNSLSQPFNCTNVNGRTTRHRMIQSKLLPSNTQSTPLNQPQGEKRPVILFIVIYVFYNQKTLKIF